MADERGYVGEHRLVMSELLGRMLDETEHVHHRNENRSDNRPENLVILSPSEHAHRHQEQYKEQRGWSRHYLCCTVCGTTERKHYAKGKCHRCDMRERMAAKYAAGYIAPGRQK